MNEASATTAPKYRADIKGEVANFIADFEASSMSAAHFYIGQQALTRRVDVDLSDVLTSAAAKASARRFTGEPITAMAELDEGSDYGSPEWLEQRRDSDRLGFRG